MRKIWWIPAVLAGSLCLSCDRKTENTYTTTVVGAPAPNDPAHNQGQNCNTCHNWNLVQVHDSGSPAYNSDCMRCHGDMSQETTLSSGVQGIHPRMCPYVYQAAGQTTTTNEVCVYCHESVDFLDKSAGNLRKQVAVGKCVTCHTAAGPGRQLYQQ
ncbi:MAG: hypothetical protein HYY16_17975 [Planctomycetes bacterium]|nr:hypothetical protein [Planctomycetota bacterium]